MAEPMVFRDKCRFFNGIQHGCCKAGLRYKDVELHADEHPRVRLPCADFGLSPDVRIPNTCPARSFYSQEEHAAIEAEHKAAVERFLATLRAGKCPSCGSDIEPSRIVGRCKYAACGHRIGQVATPPGSGESSP